MVTILPLPTGRISQIFPICHSFSRIREDWKATIRRNAIVEPSVPIRRRSRRSARSASQGHFVDLCEVLKHPKVGAVDPKGPTFTTERRVRIA